MPKNTQYNYDADYPMEGKNVDQTDLNKPGAKEPYADGTNEVKRQKTKHGPFGKLGAKSFGDSD